ncbi:MAG: hypothetical protein JWM93_1781 [Frankiales bacterium]|nr:hypothetical protein [Frankiales bacterium]
MVLGVPARIVGVVGLIAAVTGCGVAANGSLRTTSTSGLSAAPAASALGAPSGGSPVDASTGSATSPTLGDSTAPATPTESVSAPSAEPSLPAPAASIVLTPGSGDPDRSHADLALVARIHTLMPVAVTTIDDTHLALLTARRNVGEYVAGWLLQEIELPSGRVTRSVAGADDAPGGVVVTPTSIYVTVSMTAKPSAARNRLIRIRRSDFSVSCRTPGSLLTDSTFTVGVAAVVWTAQYDGSLLRFADGGCISTPVPVALPARAAGVNSFTSNGQQLVMTSSWPTSDTLPAADSSWEGHIAILDGADGQLVSTVPLKAAHLYAGTQAVAMSGNVVLAADEVPRQIHVVGGAGVTTVAGPTRIAGLTDGVSLAADADGCIVMRGIVPGACPDFLRGATVIGSAGNTAILSPDMTGDEVELIVVRVSRL